MFRNPQCSISQINGDLPYLIGPSPLVCYPVDDFRVEVSTLSPSQVSVQRAAGMFDDPYCLLLTTTMKRATPDFEDNANLEIWVEPTDETLVEAKWGKPSAQPITASFNTQFDIPGNITFSMHDWQNTVSCCKVLNYPSSTPISRAQITFPPMPTGDFSQGAKLVINLGFPDAGRYATNVADVVTPTASFQVNGTDQLVDKPIGTHLKFGNWQADVGSVAKDFRRLPKWHILNSCQEVLFKTMPWDTAVNNAARPFSAAAGFDGAVKILTTTDSSGAGFSTDLRFPVHMLRRPVPYVFSPYISSSKKWFRENGMRDSGSIDIWDLSSNSCTLRDGVTNNPNGSIIHAHAVFTCQQGGNGILNLL